MAGSDGKGQRWRRLAAFLAGALVVSSLLVELGARLWLTRFADDETARNYATLDQLRDRSRRTGVSFSRFEPHHYIGYVPSPNYRSGGNAHNSLGFRGTEIAQPKPRGQFRIVCLGGSTTYTQWVGDHRFSYPSLLETELRKRGHANVRVINAGVPGYSSYESLLNFEFRVLDLDPDMVILYQAVNDVVVRLVWPREAYRGDNSGAIVHSTGFYRPLPPLERSTAIRMLLIRFGLAASPAALERTFHEPARTFHGWAFLLQKGTGSYPRGIFRAVDARTMLDVNDTRYFERNVEAIAVLARHHGIQPVLATFAHLRGGADALSSDEIAYGIEQSNAVLLALGRELGVPVFDFASALPPDPSLFVDGVHVNAEGSRKKAMLFADFLVGAGLLPRH